MRIKNGFITHETAAGQVMVSAGSDFSGLVRSNRTAAFVIDLLKNDVTEEDIVSAMLEKYNAPREVIEKDVKALLSKLRGIGAIDE